MSLSGGRSVVSIEGMQELSQSDLQALYRDIMAEFGYFATHLPFKDSDDLTVVLKGHLLVEEQLIAYVHRRLLRPEKLERFTFVHYLGLAEACNDIAVFDWVFEATRKLNGIRNKMAHQLSPKGVETAVVEYVDYVRQKGAAVFPTELANCNRLELRMAIFAVYASLRNLNRKQFVSMMPVTVMLESLVVPESKIHP